MKDAVCGVSFTISRNAPIKELIYWMFATTSNGVQLLNQCRI